MKSIRSRALLFLALIAVLQSLQGCRRAMYAYKSYRPEGNPSVTLKTGDVIADEEVRKREPFFGRDKVVAGDRTFLAKDVKYYQTAKGRYANVGKNNFAEQLQGGPLNLYRYTYTYTTTSTGPGGSVRTSTREANVDYVQKGGPSAPIVVLSPKSLRPLVADYRPSQALMEREAQLRRTQRIIGYGCLGGTALGIGLIAAGVSASNNNPSSSNGSGAALAGVGLLFGSGMTALFKSGIYSIKRYAKMHEAIQAYSKKP